MDHKGFHRNGLVRALEGVHIEPGLFPVLVIAELAIFFLHRRLNARRSTSSATYRPRRGIELQGSAGPVFSYRRTGALVGFEQGLKKTTVKKRGLG